MFMSKNALFRNDLDRYSVCASEVHFCHTEITRDYWPQYLQHQLVNKALQSHIYYICLLIKTCYIALQTRCKIHTDMDL